MKLGCAGQAGEVTRLPSTKAPSTGIAWNAPPANVTSGHDRDPRIYLLSGSLSLILLVFIYCEEWLTHSYL